MPKPSTIYNRWDVVVTPFPFVDSAQTKSRPALVLSSTVFNTRNGHSVLAMITRAGRTQWSDDVAIVGLEEAGLPVQCVVRPKIFTLANHDLTMKIGVLGHTDRQAVSAAILRMFEE